VEQALDKMENTYEDIYKACLQRTTPFNLDSAHFELLRQIKRERKYVITATDENLGPAVIDTTQYITRAMDDHLPNTANYLELSSDEAHLEEETNFRWICQQLIDNTRGTLTA
jgi:hypothetical protein